MPDQQGTVSYNLGAYQVFSRGGQQRAPSKYLAVREPKQDNFFAVWRDVEVASCTFHDEK